MATEWRGTLADLAREGVLAFGDGYRTKQSELGRPGFPILRVAQIVDGAIEMAEIEGHVREEYRSAIGPKLSQVDDVVLTTKGTFGRRAIVRSDTSGLVYSPQVCYFRVTNRAHVDPRYLYYWLGSEAFLAQAVGLTAQTDMAAYLSLRDLGRVKVTLPDVDEQRRIAGTPGALDDKIELNRRMSETLESMARALFDRWFVRAEASSGWPLEPLAAHLEVIRGLSYKGDGLASTGVPLHNLNSVYEGGGYKPDGLKWYSGSYAERHTVKPGDVIVTNTEQGHDRLLIGHAALVPGTFGGLGLFSHHLYRVRPRPNSVLSQSFVAYLLNSPAMHNLVSGYSNGTTVQMLPVEALQQPAIRIPPASLVRRFDALATISHQRQEVARSEARVLATFRDALLPRLMAEST